MEIRNWRRGSNLFNRLKIFTNPLSCLKNKIISSLSFQRLKMVSIKILIILRLKITLFTIILNLIKLSHWKNQSSLKNNSQVPFKLRGASPVKLTRSTWRTTSQQHTISLCKYRTTRSNWSSLRPKVACQMRYTTRWRPRWTRYLMAESIFWLLTFKKLELKMSRICICKVWFRTIWGFWGNLGRDQSPCWLREMGVIRMFRRVTNWARP